MPDYSKGKIYGIRAPGVEGVYIGSTTVDLNERFMSHKTVFKYHINGGPAGAILKHPGAFIELIEDFPCESRQQLHRREGEIIRSTPNAINKVIPGRTQTEYRELHKEHYKQLRQDYYETNKDKINERRRKYSIANKEKLSEKKREWYLNNKVKEDERSRNRYNVNKDKINERRRMLRCAKKNLNSTDNLEPRNGEEMGSSSCGVLQEQGATSPIPETR